MDRRQFTLGLAAMPWVLEAASRGWGSETTPPASATIAIDANREIGRVDPKIYGHFLEHVERVVYGGISDRNSSKSDEFGIRQDVVAAIREMGGAHVLRWPGGNFASYYHWRDGVGPLEQRPRRFDVVWKNWESNQFGTDEYLALCRELNCDPFITANLGNGTLQEACEWVEYTRMESRKPPVRIWGLGNEHYGAWQVGHYTAEEYGRKVQQFGQFMRAVSPDLQYIGVGNWDPNWNKGVLAECGSYLDWISLHLYSHRYFLNGIDDFDSSVAAPAYFEQVMKNVSTQLEAAEPGLKRDRPIQICLEEWNGRHFIGGGETGKPERLLRESPRNIVDALFVAGVFNACQRLSRRVTMTNYVFLLNAHGPLMVNPEGVLKTVLFDVFRLYSTVTHPVAVATEVKAETFSTQVHQSGPDVPVTTARVDASATRSVDGRKITLSMINRYRDRPCIVSLDVKAGRIMEKAQLHMLKADSLTEVNSWADPNRIRATTQTVSLSTSRVELPPASVAHLELVTN